MKTREENQSEKRQCLMCLYGRTLQRKKRKWEWQQIASNEIIMDDVHWKKNSQNWNRRKKRKVKIDMSNVNSKKAKISDEATESENRQEGAQRKRRMRRRKMMKQQKSNGQ